MTTFAPAILYIDAGVEHWAGVPVDCVRGTTITVNGWAFGDLDVPEFWGVNVSILSGGPLQQTVPAHQINYYGLPTAWSKRFRATFWLYDITGNGQTIRVQQQMPGSLITDTPLNVRP